MSSGIPLFAAHSFGIPLVAEAWIALDGEAMNAVAVAEGMDDALERMNAVARMNAAERMAQHLQQAESLTLANSL